MIVADRKPLEEILASVEGKTRVTVVGCNSCTAVCMTGGEREVQILASQLRIARRERGGTIEVTEMMLERHCEVEFASSLEPALKAHEAMISLACGVGVNMVSDLFPWARIVPGVNTTFYGSNVGQGKFVEQCGGCGDCMLDRTGGVCPIARCAKSLLNGPCGGCQDGKCEVNRETDCAWYLIWDRLKTQGRLELLERIEDVRDWRTAGHGGPRSTVRAEVVVNGGE